MVMVSKAKAAIAAVLVGCAANVVTLELLVNKKYPITMALATILLVMTSCMARETFMEELIKKDPGCGNLITFSSFLFISLEGFVVTTKFGTVSPVVPFKSWTAMVLMYFLVSVTNNYALNFNISMPLHMIFRAGSLIANMVLGMIILHKRYTLTKYLSVLMITAGIATCTIMSAQTISEENSDSTSIGVDGAQAKGGDANEVTTEDSSWELVRWCFGIALLIFALLMSARMGIYQEVIYKKYGKHPKEALFYSHFLPLPGFLLLYQNIYDHFLLASASDPITLVSYGSFSLSMPSMWLYLAANVVTQYICISAVFVLTTECASLTVTLVVTLRKFLSLLFSIWYFQNPFTVVHWIGTALVFGGTLLFSDIQSMISDKFKRKDKVTKTE